MADTTEKENQQSVYSTPMETINNCVEIVQQIYNAKGDGFVTAPEIFAITGKPRGTMVLRISACVHYGLLSNQRGAGYKVTDLFIAIVQPEFPTDVRKKKLQALSTPELYAKLIERYNAKPLPSNQGLANILTSDYVVNKNSAPKVASVFLENCADLDLNEGGRLRFFMPATDSARTPSMSLPTPPLPNNGESGHNGGIKELKFNFYLSDGKMSSFTCPNNLNVDDIQILKLEFETKLKTLVSICKVKNVDTAKLSLNDTISTEETIKENE